MRSDTDIAERLRRAAESLPVQVPGAEPARRRGRRRFGFRLASAGAAGLIGLAGVMWALVALGPLGGGPRETDRPAPAASPTFDPSTSRIVAVPYNDVGVPVPEGWAADTAQSDHIEGFVTSTSHAAVEEAIRGCQPEGGDCSYGGIGLNAMKPHDAFVQVDFVYPPSCAHCERPDPLPPVTGPDSFGRGGELLGAPVFQIVGIARGGDVTVRYWIGPEATDATRDATLFVVEHLGLPTGSPITHADEDRGFTVTYPADWTRSTEPPDPQVVDPVELVTMATYGPEVGFPGCETFPPEVGDDDAYVQVLERDPNYQRETFPQRPAQFTPEGSQPFSGWKDCNGFSPNYDAYWIPFSDAGRNFYAFVAIGPEASEAREADAWEALNSLEVEPLVEEPRDPDPDQGDSVVYHQPRGWIVAGRSLTPELVSPKEVFSAGTFRLRAGETGCDFILPLAAADVGPTDALITVQEVVIDAGPGADPAFVPWPDRPGREAFRDFLYPCLQPEGAFEGLARWVKRDRYFYVYVAIGAEASAERDHEVWKILGSLDFVTAELVPAG
jgi:hypothetical protein